MSMYFNQTKFKEIINGLVACCDLNPEQLLKSATEIYLSSAAEDRGESIWSSCGSGCTVKVSSIVRCQACGHERGRFVGDVLDYCPACGKIMKMGEKC